MLPGHAATGEHGGRQRGRGTVGDHLRQPGRHLRPVGRIQRDGLGRRTEPRGGRRPLHPWLGSQVQAQKRDLVGVGARHLGDHAGDLARGGQPGRARAGLAQQAQPALAQYPAGGLGEDLQHAAGGAVIQQHGLEGGVEVALLQKAVALHDEQLIRDQQGLAGVGHIVEVGAHGVGPDLGEHLLVGPAECPGVLGADNGCGAQVVQRGEFRPQYRAIPWSEVSMRRRVSTRGPGQETGDPSGVAAQSIPDSSSPNAPPSANTRAAAVRGSSRRVIEKSSSWRLSDPPAPPKAADGHSLRTSQADRTPDPTVLTTLLPELPI